MAAAYGRFLWKIPSWRRNPAQPGESLSPCATAYPVPGMGAGILRRALPVLVLAAILGLATAAGASSIMAVGQDEGYSGRVLDKVVAKWNPPPQLKGEYKLKLRIGVDGEGNVLECNATKSSGLKALDVSACSAVRAGAPYGPPPYGMPSDLYLSFWTGDLPGQVKLSPATSERTPLVDTYSLNRARDANERARAAAEAAAKSTGRPLPDMDGKAKKQNVKPEKAEVKKSEGKKGKEAEKGKAAAEPALKPHKAATQPEHEKTLPKEPKHAVAVKPSPDEKVPSVELAPAGASADTGDESREEERRRKYLSKITWELRKLMYVPVEAPVGTYTVTARIKCDKSGKILDSSILEGSGNEYIDRNVLRGIKKAKRIIAPPPGFGDVFDLTFSLVR